MPNVLIRGIEEQVLRRLKERARQCGRSLQSELKSVLEVAARSSLADTRAAAGKLRASFTAPLSDSVELIREDRER